MWEQLLSEAVVHEAERKRAHAALVREARSVQRLQRVEQRQRWKQWWSHRPSARPLAPAAPVAAGRVVATISRPLHG